MDIHNSLVFPKRLTPLELAVCHLLADHFLDTNIPMFVLPYDSWRVARLPISIEQVSDLFWWDVYPVIVWTAGQWAAWVVEDVKAEIEGRRFSVLSRLSRFWTWPLMTVLLYRPVMRKWEEMERRILAEIKKREYVVNWGRSVGWNVITWRADEVLVEK